MKALEILKRIYINNPDTRFQRNNIDINFTIHDFSNVNEAIKELEALENRSCDNCKNAYYQDFANDLDDDVYSCDEFESSFININDSGRPKDFSCKKWESK